MPESALFNTPPITENDRYIITAMLIVEEHPANNSVEEGFKIDPQRPQNYHFQSEGLQIIVACIICIIAMGALTGLRFYIRSSKRGSSWGIDDWLMIPGLVPEILYLLLFRD